MWWASWPWWAIWAAHLKIFTETENQLNLRYEVVTSELFKKSHHWAAAADPGTSPGMFPGVTTPETCLLPMWWASWPWWAIWAAHLWVWWVFGTLQTQIQQGRGKWKPALSEKLFWVALISRFVRVGSCSDTITKVVILGDCWHTVILGWLKKVILVHCNVKSSCQNFKKSHHWAAAADPGTSPGMFPGVTTPETCLLPMWWASWPWWAIWAAHLNTILLKQKKSTLYFVYFEKALYERNLWRSSVKKLSELNSKPFCLTFSYVWWALRHLCLWYLHFPVWLIYKDNL